MVAETTYKISEKELQSFMRQYGFELFLSSLTGNRIGTAATCEILRISPRTLTNWIQAGTVIVKNTGEKAHEFDLHDIIKLLLIKSKKYNYGTT